MKLLKPIKHNPPIQALFHPPPKATRDTSKPTKTTTTMAPDPSLYPPEFSAPESSFRRILRRGREEPLIPLGMVLTVAAFSGAARAIKARDHARANIMFRRRIYAQGFTLLAIVAGSLYLKGDREKKKEVEALEKEKEASIKRELWLKELEARDEEDKAAKERVKVLVERRKKRRDEVERRSKESKAQGEVLSAEDNDDEKR